MIGYKISRKERKSMKVMIFKVWGLKRKYSIVHRTSKLGMKTVWSQLDENRRERK